MFLLLRFPFGGGVFSKMEGTTDGLASAFRDPCCQFKQYGTEMAAYS